MLSERSERAAFSRIEICVVLANLILLVLIVIPAFRPVKPLERGPDTATRLLSEDAPVDPKGARANP